MAVEGIITQGIGSAPGGLFSFITLGLTPNEAADSTPTVFSGQGSVGALSGEGSKGTLSGTGGI